MRRGERLLPLLLVGHNQEEVVKLPNVDLVALLAKEFPTNRKDQNGDRAIELQAEDNQIHLYQVSDEEAPSVVVIQQLLDHDHHNPNQDLFHQKIHELALLRLKLVLLVPVRVSLRPNSRLAMAPLDHHSHMHLNAGRPFQLTGKALLHSGSADSKITATISTVIHSPNSFHDK